MLRQIHRLPRFASILFALVCLPAAAQDAPPVPAQPPVQLIPARTLAEAPVERTATDVSERLFPRYAPLKPATAFWTRIFSDYSENQSLIHSASYPHKVFTVLDFRDDALRLDENQLARVRSREEGAAKARIELLLKRVAAKQGSPETMSADERKVYSLFSDLADDPAFSFKRMIGTLRAQRGLKERTERALATSGKYLPEMERIFSSYGLPVQLTRLPLVESSFNIEAYSKVGAAGLWQFMPSSARIYMRLNELVDDRRDPWTSTDAAARHLRDDYAQLQDWPLAITAYNHGRGGISSAMKKTGSANLAELVRRNRNERFGFASRNFYAEFLAAVDVEREHEKRFGLIARKTPMEFEVVETRHYVPYETLRRLCGADDELFRKLNPAYRPEVLDGKLYVPPGHLIRVPAGAAKTFAVAYSKLGQNERFDAQRVYFLLHKVQRGQNLGKIARQYGVPQAGIMAASGLRKGAKLRIGQVLKIPPHREARPGPITVAVGESKPVQTRAQKLAEAAPARSDYKLHRVKRGQTLSSIARRYKVSVVALQRANDLNGSSTIHPGMKLRVPLKS
ncbi:MAG TPA: LysM peptidoglycan-binding domain-containing protein [Solimonas sp.]|nr:LysM peptidoglycan-binding domain-containing protein [Solimonas sp.]